jgi:hypothetical protein
LIIGLLLLAVPATASADVVRDCDVYAQVKNTTLAHAGITSVRNMSCRAARHALRRHGDTENRDAYGNAGSRFSLGPWSCTVYLHNYELWQARCVRGGRAFRVDYGF